MNTGIQGNRVEPDIPVLTQKVARTDLVSALTVEIALALSHLLGTKVAAKFLSRHAINIKVATRVLLHPSQRRRFAD